MPDSLNNTTETTTASDSLVDTASYIQHKNDQKLVDMSNTENSDLITESRTEAETVDSVNLCGAVTLQDVRQLLTEWINSTPGNELFHGIKSGYYGNK